MTAMEINFDGMIGPTHHYGGLAQGNLASQENQGLVSHPRRAALQGLAKMKLLYDLGVPQGIFPPQHRPHWGFLSRHGYSGTPGEVITRVFQERRDLLSIAYSASAMWAANAATVSPSADTADGRVHLTPANLVSTPHRVLESEETAGLLRKIFHDRRHFAVYDSLPHDEILADEGAANHTRFCRTHADPGVELFVYGKDFDTSQGPAPVIFKARQSRQACERIAAMHDLSERRRVFAQQSPEAIDAGVFHNDVIAVGNENVLLCHEQAYVDQQTVLDQIQSAMQGELLIREVTVEELSIRDAVTSYFFNSQLVTLNVGAASSRRMLLLCPVECEAHPGVRRVIDSLIDSKFPIEDVRFVDVRESMQNGGGPACLRLRVVLTDAERETLGGNVLFTPELHDTLVKIVSTKYRESLRLEDLAEPGFAEEAIAVVDEIQAVLGVLS